MQSLKVHVNNMNYKYLLIDNVFVQYPAETRKASCKVGAVAFLPSLA